ncbi:MAG: putative outer membrane protein pmp20 [Ramlibacter sp.]|nr:putative outer membrane protein pmp20 [Ramlibacter sp.]
MSAAVAIPVAVQPGAPVDAQPAGGRTGLGAAAESFALPGDGPLAGIPLVERSLLAAPGRVVVEVETLRPFQLAAIVLRGTELLQTEQADLTSIRFTLSSRGEGASVEELQRTFRSAAFSGQLDHLRANLQEELDLDRTMTISVAGVSLGLSLVYVIWLIRGGVLMGSYLSALPAWRVLDPLPVLSRVDDEADEDDEALDAVSDRGGNPLRGFG